MSEVAHAHRITLVQARQSPRWAYTIGLTEVGAPELVLADATALDADSVVGVLDADLSRSHPYPRGMSDPASYLTLEPGADVLDSTGERIGTVEHVLRDEASDIFDGLVIDIATGPGGHRFVDAPDVGEMREGTVALKLTADQVEGLDAPSASPGVMEHHGEEDSESPLQGKLRRAWELISGKGPS